MNPLPPTRDLRVVLADAARTATDPAVAEWFRLLSEDQNASSESTAATANPRTEKLEKRARKQRAATK